MRESRANRLRTFAYPGSSRISGKRRADFEKEVRVVAKAVGHALEDLDLVVDAFKDAGVQRKPAMSEHPGQLPAQPPRERDQRRDATAHGPAIPLLPRAPGGADICIAPERLEPVLEHVDYPEPPIRREQLLEPDALVAPQGALVAQQEPARA